MMSATMAVNPPQRAQARLVEKIAHNDKFIQYSFEYIQPPVINFTAGQYMSLQVAETGERRSYSICSSTEKNHGCEFLADISPQGIGSKYLENLEVGQPANILGPLGVFTIPQDQTEQNIVLIATGSGIAPFRSMILDQLQERKDPRPIWLYWGMRHENQLFWVEEFEEIADAFPQFHFHPVISQAGNEWPLCRGRVTDCLRVHEQPPAAGYYICGNNAMVHDTIALLQEQGITPEHIHHEKFN